MAENDIDVAPDSSETDPGPPTAVSDSTTRQLLRSFAGGGVEEDVPDDMEDELEHRLHDHLDAVSPDAEELGLDPEREITPVDDVDEDEEEVEFRTIKENRSYVRVTLQKDRDRYRYEVIEPPLLEAEERALEFLRDTLKRTIERPDGDEDWDQYLRRAIARAIINHDVVVDEIARKRVTYYLVRDFLGYSQIDAMMKDPMVEDISCDGPGINVYIYHRQYESMPSNVVPDDEEELDAFVRKLAQRAGKHISIANPMLDATLPDSSRLQATLSREVTTRGSSFTIRRFRADPFTPPDLCRLGTMNPRMAAYYWMAVEEGHSLLFAGGTASGKTTSLNAVAQFIPPDAKIVTIEDTREMNLEHENWVASLTRSGGGGSENSGGIDMYELLEAALRQRPEYLIVGEVRGEEAHTLFQAMATGHATYSTVHADSVAGAIHRLENPPINVPRSMIETLDIITVQEQTRVAGDTVRRVSTVAEIVEVDSETGELVTNTTFRRNSGKDLFEEVASSHVMKLIRRKQNLSRDEVMAEWERRADVIEWMVENGVRQIQEVWDVVTGYYKDPEGVVEQVRKELGRGKK